MLQSRHEAAMLDHVPEGGMRQVEVQGHKILLVRENGVVSAMGAACPHAGAPLAEGVLQGGRIVCPWHKAAFCSRTGALRDPPAMDPLPRYEVFVDGNRILVGLPALAADPVPATDDTRHFVIVGGGAAGAMAAQTLRQEGFGGEITVLDRENRVPYDRTLLSKYHLSGAAGAEKSPLQSQSFYRDARIRRRTAEVIHIDPDAKSILCADGSRFHYDAALLATGAAPLLPFLPGVKLANVFRLRSRADADAILLQAERSKTAVVLGANFIGMEVAASLRERGLDVTVISDDPAPFAKHLGDEIGGAFTRLHEQRGVSFRLGATVQSLQGNSKVAGVVLEGGETLRADLVIIGFGVKPVTNYVGGLKLNDDGGIAVDSYMRVAEGLYAAGDIAAFPQRGEGEPIRVEHWRVALQHGRIAALNMLGHATPYTAVPVFWTIQYMKRLDYVGHARDWDEIVLHGDLEKPEFIAYYVKDGAVAAAAGMDRDRDMAALIVLFEQREGWTAEELGDAPARRGET